MTSSAPFPIRKVPVVMAIAGSDPSGGAGIQADIEALSSMGCHAAPIITTVTVQDTADVNRIVPLPSELVTDQARVLLADIQVAAIKLGLLGSVEIVEAIYRVLLDHPDIPVVLDPVLATGKGTPLADGTVLAAVQELLLPQTSILTPNVAEARLLAPGAREIDTCAAHMIASGCEFVLITGADEPSEKVVNRFYGDTGLIETFTWERLPGNYHGTGCTLASGIAGLLAQGQEPREAVQEAQGYTWESLRQSYRIGRGQALPNRLFWARYDHD
jgi:hydroxymethylpyrimidine/phosphomethylpyrimidine kinase